MKSPASYRGPVEAYSDAGPKDPPECSFCEFRHDRDEDCPGGYPVPWVSL